MTAAPRRAATVLVLRDAPAKSGLAGVEVLLVRRGRGAPFMADAYVFPGGRVDEADGAPEGGTDSEAASRACALRELREEVGLAVADPAALVPFSHWITPSGEPRRFDTAFYLVAMPAGQTPVLDEREVTDLLWLAPEAALARFAEGGLKLPPPTLCNLEDLRGELAAAGASGEPLDAARLIAACGGRRPTPILPKLLAAPDGLVIVMPWDPAFPDLPGEGDPAPRPAHVTTRRCVATLAGAWRAER